MNRSFRIALPVWYSSDGREPSPARGPRRSGAGGDSPRPVPNATWLLVFAIMAAVALVFGLQFASGGGAQVDYSFFRDQLESGASGNIESIIFRDDKISGAWKDPPEDPKKDEKQPGKKLPKKFSTT